MYDFRNVHLNFTSNLYCVQLCSILIGFMCLETMLKIMSHPIRDKR